MFRLLDSYPAVLATMRTAADRCEALWEAFAAEEPEHPAALHRRPDDGFRINHAVYRLRDGREADIYEHGDVERLRAMPQPTRCEETRTPFPGRPGDEIVRRARLPDEHRIARRAEIVAAHDAWWAECDVIKDRLGIPAADAADDQATTALWDLEAIILATAPRTLAGLAAKARWVAECRLNAMFAADWHKRLVEDVIALAQHGGETA
jgi:hypothetical protein